MEAITQKTEIVRFYESELDFVFIENIPYIVLKSLWAALGIKEDNGVSLVKNDEILSEVTLITGVAMPQYRGQKVLCTQLNFLPGILFRISINKIKPESRDILKIFQKECFQALSEHFFGSKIRKLEQRELLINKRAEIAQEYSRYGRQLRDINKQIFDSQISTDQTALKM